MKIAKKILRLFYKREVSDNSDFNFENEIKLTDLDGESFRYKGQKKNDKPDGFGEALYEGGDIYIGYFKNQKREGIGMYKWKSGDYYVGNWWNNDRKGFGINYLKTSETVVFGEFDGLKLVNESGLISKHLKHDHCLLCGKNKKYVRLLIAGGVGNRAICDSCVIIAMQTLNNEMKYSETELVDLLNENTGNSC